MGPVSEFAGGRVVIIGGGVVGLSVAYHLVARGHRDVTVVERNRLGSGTTSKGTGGIRQQFSSEINILLSRRAVDWFRRSADLVDFRQHGYLFLLDRPEHMDTFETNAAKQRAAGVPVSLLDPTEIPDVMPHVDTDGLVGASYCPTDGSASPRDLVAVFSSRAREHGASLREGTEVTAIERDAHGAVRAVRTDAGPIEADTVVNAAGPWAAEVGRLLDISLPITPHRRQAFEITPLSWLVPSLPFTIDLASGAYVHPGNDVGVIGGNDRDTAAGFDAAVDWGLTRPLMEALIRRIPAMAEAEITRGWAGLRDMTPDDHAIVGPVEAVPGFWVAAGFSGHGFMHSPLVGELIAEWLIDGVPGMDLGALGIERFEGGTSVSETAVF
jgi:sarcosine oxidase subunit beta